MEMALLQDIVNGLPLLTSSEDREKLLVVVGALVLRRISLDKASEIMGMQRSLPGAVRSLRDGVFLSGGEGCGSREELVMVVVFNSVPLKDAKALLEELAGD